MSNVKKERVNGISRQQSSKMRRLLAELWPEVWQVVETRVNNQLIYALLKGVGGTKGKPIQSDE